MKVQVSTYEEARQVIEKYVDKEVVLHNLRILKLHIMQGTAVIGAFAIALGIATGDVMTTICLLPSVAVVAFAAYIPYRMYTKTLANIRDGSYFDSKTEAETIRIANEYVDVYNNVTDLLREEQQRPPLFVRILNHF